VGLRSDWNLGIYVRVVLDDCFIHKQMSHGSYITRNPMLNCQEPVPMQEFQVKLIPEEIRGECGTCSLVRCWSTFTSPRNQRCPYKKLYNIFHHS